MQLFPSFHTSGSTPPEGNSVGIDFHFEPAFVDSEPDLSRLGPDQRRAYRFALQILENTEDELMEIVDKLENEPGRAFLNDFAETVEQHKADAAILESAHVRLMTATAVYAESQGEQRASRRQADRDKSAFSWAYMSHFELPGYP